MTTAFHLNNREAKRELKDNNGRLLPFCPTPTYLGVKLDRSLTFRHHLVALRKKLSSRVTLLRRLVGSGWGAGAKTLRIATLSLVYSTAEYCAPVWCRSAHTRLIDSVLNDALRIVTGCLRPTPTDHLPVISGIQPAELRRLGATLSLAYRGYLDPDHILYGIGDPKSYRPISLFCVSYKILERFFYARVEPLIDPLLPKEQAGFQRGKSTVDQVVLLTQNIENSFEAKKKAGAVFVDLTAAYDIVWHRGLTCKLLSLLPDKHMVRIIMELVQNRNFTLTTGDSKQSRLRRLKNGVPQGSVLAPLLFNIYTYDLPSMISRKFAYADDLALLHSSRNWKDLEGTLSQDMLTLSAYLQI